MATDWSEHVRRIAQWQAENNCLGVPPVYWHKGTNNWYQDARRRFRALLDKNPLAMENPPPYAQALIDLGLGDKLARSEVHAQQTTENAQLQGARGLHECAMRIIEMASEGKFPSFAGPTMRERHLACWLITMQIGMQGDNKAGVTEHTHAWAMIDRVIADVASIQTDRQLVCEWLHFCVAIDHVMQRVGMSADQWRRFVTEPSPEFFDQLYPALPRLKARVMANGPARLPSMPSPVEMIRAVNYVFWLMRRPVSFRDDRTSAQAFEEFLRAGGYKISPVLRRGMSKVTGQYASSSSHPPRMEYFLDAYRNRLHGPDDVMRFDD